MFAVIRTGGKQYRVALEDIIEVEKIAGDEGAVVQFADVLMVGGEGALKVGTPMLSGVSVAGNVVAQKRAAKILVFKKKRRKNYRRKRGHRQNLDASAHHRDSAGRKGTVEGQGGGEETGLQSEGGPGRTQGSNQEVRRQTDNGSEIWRQDKSSEKIDLKLG